MSRRIAAVAAVALSLSWILPGLWVTPEGAAQELRPGSPYDRGYEKQYDYRGRLLERDFWELRDTFGQIRQDRHRLGYERGRADERLYRYQYDPHAARAREFMLRREYLARRGHAEPKAADADRGSRSSRVPPARSVWHDDGFERFGFAPNRDGESFETRRGMRTEGAR